MKLFVLVLAIMFFVSGCAYTHVLTPYDTNLDKTVLGRLIQPAEMAEVVVDVATARSHVFCGQVVHANGGRIMP